MVDLEGQDHGPSSSSVGDNDDDSIVYSKEGNNARWFKKEGDEVSAEDILCEVETVWPLWFAMECAEEVFLAKIIHGDGAKVIKVGEVNATTMEGEDDIAKFKDYKPSQLGDSKEAKVPSDPSPPTLPKKEDTEPVSSAEPKKPKVANAPQSGAQIFASPLARKLANDHNVPLSNIKGTGSDGIIVQGDIEDYLASSGKGVSAPPTSKPKDKATEAGINYTDLPISQIRKVTVSSLLTIPHYYLTVDTCVDKLMELQSQLNSLQEASDGERISVNDLVVKAAALALCKVPQCNGSWYHSVNAAVQTEHGLFVPVVRDADKKGLCKIADEGGTFTVSNLGGTYGIKQFCAIINPPQSGILAVGSGAIGPEWLKAFKGYVENPKSMLL
ncbi:hypothetical protein Sjap_017953 [Stephania japonica]|uniref:Peripheral subunit-binding (PSBD) domain-containing protein n=1 Tax=Stephania japonica TaxID=461633 RepID=A0AAP0I7A2_9MAGN